MSVGEHEMRHDLLVYDSDDGFARYVALFVEEGVEAGQPVVVVTDSHLRAVLMDTLSASDAAAVTFRDRDEVYTRPEAALAAYDSALRALLRGGAEAIRVYGELPFCREPEQQIAWQRYEAIVNHVFAAQPVWVTCGYNARLLPPQIVDDAWRTHREVHSQGWCENPHYQSPRDVVRSLAPAADALPGLRSLPLVEDEQAFRRLLAGELARDGVAADKAARAAHGVRRGARQCRATRRRAARPAGGPCGRPVRVRDHGRRPRARRPVRGLQAAAPACRPRWPLDGAAADDATRSPVVGQRPHRAALDLTQPR